MPALMPCSCRYKHPSRDQHSAGAQHRHAHWGERLQPTAPPDQRAACLRDHLHQWHPSLPRYSPWGGGVCLAHAGCLRGVPHPRNTLNESAMCSCGITAGRREFRQGAALPLHGGAWPGTLSRWSCACIPGFLWLILSSFSFLFSSQLKAPRWQTPFSRPTPACSTMQVSNFASHSFPLSPLCSLPLFLGGEHHPGVER